MKEGWKKFKEFVLDNSMFIALYKLFEELIARVALIAVSNIFSVLFCVTLTQCTQALVKKCSKNFTTQKGAEEVKFIKNLSKLVWYNKWTIIMCLISVFSGYCLYAMLPTREWLRIILGCSLLGLGIISATQIGAENLQQIEERININKEKNKNKKELRLKNKKEKEQKKIDIKIKKDITKLVLEENKHRMADLVKEFEEKKLNFQKDIENIIIQRCEDAKNINRDNLSNDIEKRSSDAVIEPQRQENQ